MKVYVVYEVKDISDVNIGLSNITIHGIYTRKQMAEALKKKLETEDPHAEIKICERVMIL